MAAPIPNFDLILQAFLRKARAQAAPLTYLGDLQELALTATLAGDEFVNGLTDEGGSENSIREIPANTLLALCEAAIQVLENEALVTSGAGYAPGDLRHADFSSHPCTLG